MALKQDIGIPCNNCTTCVGFKIHGWRKFCVDCKCSVENHDISDESTLSILDEMKLFDKQFYSSYQDSIFLASKVQKSWLPIGLKYNEIDEFTSLLPNMCDRGSDERLRKRKLRLQVPVTDRCVEKFCHLETTSERQEAEKFLLNRNNRDIGLGYVIRITDDKSICADCQITLRPNSLSVTIEHNSDTPKQFWHPYCFKCTTCQELLVDFIYASHNHKVYCIRHYAKTIRPRCGACDELIFANEYIRVNNDEFHSNHFACTVCDVSLSKQTYFSHQSSAICKNCYELKYSNQCRQCQKIIPCDSKDVSYNDTHWHEDCFHCSYCNITLVDKLFATIDNQLYCETCNRDRNLPRCAHCNKPIENGMKMVEKTGKSWHLECVLCDDCKNPIGTDSYVNHDNRSICMTCYDRKFAKKCPKCDDLVRGGVSFQGQKYHSNCFKCCNCSCGIVNCKYILKNGAFYCKACYDRLFSSSCTKCTQLISAETGLKYVKFEEKTWHTTCFNCHKCTGSLIDKGFILKDNNTYCTQCGS